jgi:hypothetical protein
MKMQILQKKSEFLKNLDKSNEVLSKREEYAVSLRK